MTPPTPSDDMWIELAQFDTEMADAIWEGRRTADEGGPRWRDELATLIEKARSAAQPDELARETPVVAAMQAVRERAKETERVDERAAGPTRSSHRHTHPRHRRPRRHSRARVLGRLLVAKGVTAIGAVGFGVAAAAATTGIVASGIVATLVVPDRLDNETPTTTEAPAGAPGIADGVGGTASERTGGAGGDLLDQQEHRDPDGEDGQTSRKPGDPLSRQADLPPATDLGDELPAEGDETGDSEGSEGTTDPGEEATVPPETVPPAEGEPPPEETTTTSTSSTTTTTTTVLGDPGDGSGGTQSVGGVRSVDDDRPDGCSVPESTSSCDGADGKPGVVSVNPGGNEP